MCGAVVSGEDEDVLIWLWGLARVGSLGLEKRGALVSCLYMFVV